MELYLIRHADALPAGAAGTASDTERPLSDKGVEQMTRLASVIQAVELPIQRLVTSPLVRARQSAEVLAEHLGLERNRVVTCDYLAPGGPRKRLARWLAQQDLDHIALVGHEPDLGRFLGWLIGSRKVHIEFAKAAIAGVACAAPLGKRCGSLLWLVPPRWWPRDATE